MAVTSLAFLSRPTGLGLVVSGARAGLECQKPRETARNSQGTRALSGPCMRDLQRSGAVGLRRPCPDQCRVAIGGCEGHERPPVPFLAAESSASADVMAMQSTGAVHEPENRAVQLWGLARIESNRSRSNLCETPGSREDDDGGCVMAWHHDP